MDACTVQAKLRKIESYDVWDITLIITKLLLDTPVLFIDTRLCIELNGIVTWGMRCSCILNVNEHVAVDAVTIYRNLFYTDKSTRILIQIAFTSTSWIQVLICLTVLKQIN